MFSVERFSATVRHRQIYRRYEIAYTLCDLIAAILFVIGSALFFSAQTTTEATWMFLIGSIFFTLRPLARTARELHLARLPVPEDDEDGDVSDADADDRKGPAGRDGRPAS